MYICQYLCSDGGKKALSLSLGDLGDYSHCLHLARRFGKSLPNNSILLLLYIHIFHHLNNEQNILLCITTMTMLRRFDSRQLAVVLWLRPIFLFSWKALKDLCYWNTYTAVKRPEETKRRYRLVPSIPVRRVGEGDERISAIAWSVQYSYIFSARRQDRLDWPVIYLLFIMIALLRRKVRMASRKSRLDLRSICLHSC